MRWYCTCNARDTTTTKSIYLLVLKDNGERGGREGGKEGGDTERIRRVVLVRREDTVTRINRSKIQKTKTKEYK